MRDRLIPAGIRSAIMALTGAFALSAPVESVAQKVVGDSASNFSLINVRNGETVQLNDFAGSIVVLDFFSYW